MNCDQCEKEAENFIECPSCGDKCCDDCIAGVRVNCFQCVNAEEDEDDEN